MVVLFLLFCFASVASMGILSCTDIRYYYVSDITVYSTFLFLSLIVGCCGVFSSFTYISYAFGAAIALGGAFLFLRMAAQILERTVCKKNISCCRTSEGKLDRRTFALGLGDVKVAALIGLVVGFVAAWKKSFSPLKAVNDVSNVCELFSCLYLITVLTFINAVFWLAARRLRRRFRGGMAKGEPFRPAIVKVVRRCSPLRYEEKKRNEKIPLVPCMVLALLTAAPGMIIP